MKKAKGKKPAKAAKKIAKKVSKLEKKAKKKIAKTTSKAKVKTNKMLRSAKKKFNTAKDKIYASEEDLMDYVKENPIKSVSAVALAAFIAGFFSRHTK